MVCVRKHGCGSFPVRSCSLSQSHSHSRLSQSLSKVSQTLLKRVGTVQSLLKHVSNLPKSKELSSNNLKSSQTIHSSTKSFSRHSPATPGHIKPSQRSHCQVGQSRNTAKDQEPKSVPTPSHQKRKSTQETSTR